MATRIFSDIIKRSNRSILKKITINDMIKSQNINHYNRSKLVHYDIKNRLCHQILCLENMPFGLGQLHHIQKIADWYIKSYKELEEYENNNTFNNNERHNTLLQAILDRHSTTFSNMSKGIFEWKKALDKRYGNTKNFFDSTDTNIIINKIDDALDIFYKNRTSIRIIINHHLNMHNNDNNNGNVGSVNLSVNPIECMADGWEEAKIISEREYGICPQIYINSKDENLYNKFIKKYEYLSIPYISIHMKNIYFEIFKNSIRGLIDRYGDEAENPENGINVYFSDKKAHNFDIKINDNGIGINRLCMDKIWSYFYTTAPNNIICEESMDHIDFSGIGPMAGLGYGLPITRLMIRYFGGDIRINSIENVGTDTYLHF